MTAFIHTKKGYVNADLVERVSASGLEIYNEDGEKETLGDATATIVELVQVSGEWEVVRVDVSAQSGRDIVVAEPVLAWGRTLEGSIVPITPSKRDGQWDYVPSLRRYGDARIFTANRDYADASELLKDM